MKQSNYKLNDTILKIMIGKTFKKYKCDPFTNMVYSVVGLYIDDKFYQLKNEQRLIDYFGYEDDVGVWNIYKVADTKIESALSDI